MMNYQLYKAATEGDLNEIKRLIKKSVIESNHYFNWNWGMSVAARGGHIDIVKLLIEKGADYWNGGMRGAALGGHIDIMEFFIEKGADDWNKGINGAVRGGRMDIIEFFINKLFNECLFNDNLPYESDHYTREDYIKFHNDYYYKNIQILKQFLVDDIVEYVLYDYLKIV